MGPRKQLDSSNPGVRWRLVHTLAAVIGLWAVAAAPLAADEDLFRKTVAPIFERSCVHCHGEAISKGKLRLDVAEQALAGGESGRVIEPGDPSSSLLIDYISGDKPEMPREAPPLSAAEVDAIRRWIAGGAKWPAGLKLADRKPLDKSLWSLQPLVRPPVPPVKPAWAERVRNPIDAFVFAKLAEKNLAPSPPADRRTLIRRLYFDLTGLPPTPEEIDAFLADKSDGAYERLVDRLLDSPHYGERWARHWLDVVHYGETHGYDKDQPRPNAWPYRDYVIRAFNADKPYGQFVQEQVAGDVLFPDTRDGIEALGFLAAGPWDLIGHAEVPETKIDGKIARHLDRDDMVTNTMQTFNSLTVQCAQCHNHKFDPITSEDYYSLQAVFAAIDRTDRSYDPDPQLARRRRELQLAKSRVTDQQQKLQAQLVSQAGAGAVAELDRRIAAASTQGRSDAAARHGYHSQIEPQAAATKWVQVDLGKSLALGSVSLFPCHDDFNGIGDGFGFPVRFKVEVSDDAEFRRGVQLLIDITSADFPNPGIRSQKTSALGRTGRYVRVTATKLAPRQNDYIFALAELEVRDPQGEHVALGKPVTALDSIEAPIRWAKQNLTDGHSPVSLRSAESGETTGVAAKLQTERRQLLAKTATPEQLAELERIERELGRTTAELQPILDQSKVYIGAVHSGSGAFTGTGVQGGKPRPIHILPRGNVLTPGAAVGPGALHAIDGLPARFNLPPDHREADRRAALARWLTDARHPLTWRSIVNRVWQYHFGRGIVETPGDFGNNGARPTHSELLDWLAVEFRDQGQSLKKLHKQIVTSAAYQQVSADQPAFSKVDADNRYLWRANRRKLEAEAVRDAMLFVAGKLDRKMGGPSFRDFVVERPEHSPHYEYHLHDPNDPKSHRRSIYRFIVRSQQQPFMTTLDCADPSMQVARRNESVSPAQALTLLNNAIVVAMSQHYAQRLAAEHRTVPAQVARAYYEATGHPPSPATQEKLANFAETHTLANLCRVLFNLNEFAFVD